MSDAEERGAFARAADVLDREDMAERIESRKFVKETAPCGPGLQVVHVEEAKPKSTFTDLVEKCGWYVASYDVRDRCDHLVLMPLPEVEQ